MASEQGRPRRSGFSVLGPAVLIGLGIIFLSNSLDLVPWTVWGSLWRFWPVILILVGVQILLGRTGAGWGISLVVAILLVIVLVGAAVAASQAGWGVPIDMGTTAEGQTGTVDKDLTRLQEARATIEFGAGRLALDSLPTASDKLVVVDYTSGTLGRAPRLRLQEQGRVGILSITGGDGFRFGRTAEPDQWNVHLAQTIPLDLTVRLGAAEGILDLTDLKARTLNLDVGASSTVVRFPARAGTTRAFVNAGAASLTLEVPPGVGARIVADSGLASIDAAPRFSRSGGAYTSEDYQTAANRLEVELKAGVSSIRIQ